MTDGGMKPHPESLYYHVAANALRVATAETREFHRKQAVVTAMVFAALCLEAFVNQENEWERNVSLENKWRSIPGLLGASRGFNEQEDPFRTFVHLIRTRNDRLVHFKPEGETHLITDVADRRYFGDLVGDVDLAQRYVECVRAMITTLHQLTGGASPLPRFLDGEEYLSTIWASVTISYETLGPRGD